MYTSARFMVSTALASMRAIACGVLFIGGRCPGEPINPLLHEGVRTDAREGVPKTTKRRSLQ